MSGEETLIGDSSAHTRLEPAPAGGYYLHRLTIRFTNGEAFSYVVREPLHAEEISASFRFAVVTSYLCDEPRTCSEILIVNLNDISFIKTEHVTLDELQREEMALRQTEQKELTNYPEEISHIGFI